MARRVPCPHCGEIVAVDVEWTVLTTRTEAAADGEFEPVTCPNCAERFACKIDRAF